LHTASDDDIAAAMRVARATIFVSTAEGFGLPPVESLHAGVPVITLADVPSIAMLPPLGQIRLPELGVEAVANAVLALEDDRVAERLWAEAATIELGTWRTFAVQVARWCAGLAAPASNVVKGHPRCKGLPATALHAP
jgi:glycosyltransferase involved in cell wall biosynthesis